jgi:hypothetical protein
MKVGCVIQGDIRRGTNEILKELSLMFDFTVLSTWADDECKAPSGGYSLILSEKPYVGGLSNRSYQRRSSASGIQAAKEAGCEYVLKWRTDMLPTKLDVTELLTWANYKIPKGMRSRLVIPAFRNLSVEQDWFSSIPDLFSFGHIEVMEMLWGDSDYDYSLSMNIPKAMDSYLKTTMLDSTCLPELYCAESELYAIFKQRLQDKLGLEFDHPTIASGYCRLFNHQRLGILWFANQQGFRSIGQAWEHPWWTEKDWENGSASTVPCGYPVLGMSAELRRLISPIRVYFDKYRQSILWGLR